MNQIAPDEKAVYFDGDHPFSDRVDLRIEDAQLCIGLSDGTTVFWPVADIRLLPDIAGKTRYVLRLISDPVARLLISDPALLVHLPHLKRRNPPKGRARLAAWAVVAIGAVMLQIFVLIPLLADRLANFIPPAGERALGEATFGQIRTALDETGLNPLAVCENPRGLAVLDEITQSLHASGEIQQEISIFVLDHDMVNAFALPGGIVVLFRGLIDAANSPDEVAAVIGHEIGHVVSRDPTRHALRSAGSIGVLGLIFGDFAGGAAVLFLTERLINAKYSQAAETGADRFAHQLLAGAGVSPAALADMFETMRKEGGEASGLVAHFISHPALEQRIQAARAAAELSADYTPILTEQGWADLQSVCQGPE